MSDLSELICAPEPVPAGCVTTAVGGPRLR